MIRDAYVELYIARILIIFYFMSEVFGRIHKHYWYSGLENPFAIMKLAVIVVTILIGVFYIKVDLIRQIRWVWILFSIFAITNLSNFTFGDLALNELYFNTKVFVKIISPIIIGLILYEYAIFNEVFFLRLGNLFLIVLYVNFVLQLIGCIWQIDILRSYVPGRFGYSGFIFARNEATLFYGLYFIYGLNKLKKKESYFVIAISLIGGILLGTKAFILLILFICIGLIYFNILGAKGKIIVLCISILATSYFIYNITILCKVFENSDFLYVVSSSRSVSLEGYFNKVLKNDLVLKSMFGLLSFRSFETQIEIVDIFVLLGIIGGLYYLVHFYRFFINGIQDRYTKYIFFVMFYLIGGLAGHVFISGVNVILLAYVYAQNRMLRNESSTHTRLAH